MCKPQSTATDGGTETEGWRRDRVIQAHVQHVFVGGSPPSPISTALNLKGHSSRPLPLCPTSQPSLSSPVCPLPAHPIEVSLLNTSRQPAPNPKNGWGGTGCGGLYIGAKGLGLMGSVQQRLPAAVGAMSGPYQFKLSSATSFIFSSQTRFKCRPLLGAIGTDRLDAPDEQTILPSKPSTQRKQQSLHETSDIQSIKR